MTESSKVQKSQKADYLKKRLKSQVWRLNHLYYIKDDTGKKILFKLNWAQKHLYNNMWYFNVILKARQLGFTTFTLIYFLDSCLFKANHSAGVIAHTREDAEDLFKNKVKFAYDNLPEWVQHVAPATQDSARKLEFHNGSSITVGTSLRSGTYQKLLVSEYGKIAARYPDKAKEIKTGALNTVHVGQQIFIESTAEGNQGEFFEVCERARKLKETGKDLTRMDPRFHFYPWYKHPGYVLNDEECQNTSINTQMDEYFEALGVPLTPGQKAFYVKKEEQQGEEMKREFPSTPAESFEQSMEGAFYTKQMTLVRKNNQICHVPHEPSKPVYTFWDIGLNDDTCIWFFQQTGLEYRFIDYHEANGEGWDYYANVLQSKGYVYTEHVWPHDGNHRIIGKNIQTSKEMGQEVGIRPIRIVPRTTSVIDDIRNYCKPVLPRCFFDEARCSVGIKHLDNYRKAWDDRNGQWKDKPLHDEASHCADAFRTFAVGYRDRQEEFKAYDNRTYLVESDSDSDLLNY